MSDQRAKALQAETEFLAGVEVNLDQAKGHDLAGKIWERVEHDEADQLRTLMSERRLYDLDRKDFPQNRRVAIHGYERKWWGGKRRTGVAIVSTLARLGDYLPADPPADSSEPVGLDELVEHVRGLVVDEKVPHIIGVCSPSGFTPDVLGSGLELPGVTLVLAEPREGGGWRTHGVSHDATERICRLFDPESTARKLRRVRDEIETRSVDLLGSGLSAAAIAKTLDLPVPVVSRAFDQACNSDRELKIMRRAGEIVLFRGAPVSSEENASMSVGDRIRQMLGLEADETKKIEKLTEQRVGLSQRRDRIYADVAKMEKREAELLERGKATKSPTVRRRVAAQISQARKEIDRQVTLTATLSKQIDILSTHIHNLKLTKQGELTKLPDADELTEVAVEAEEMLETLKADADLVGSLETGVADAMASDDELAILAEFEDADASTAGPEPGRAEEASDAAATFEPPEKEKKEKRGEAEAL